jgi:hypothetical protein
MSESRDSVNNTGVYILAVKDHKKQVQEIQGLKAELLNKDEENLSPNRTIKEEQVNCWGSDMELSVW